MTAILETEMLGRRFGGFAAVQNVSLSVHRGTIHALIGPNGAGKTTLFNLLSGFLVPTAGRIRFNGVDITGMKPARIARMGLVRSFQISAVFPQMTVLENVRIALQRGRGIYFQFWRSDVSLRVLHARAMALLESVGIADLAERPVTELPYGHRRAVEIAATLALEPELMLLDEPTAGMSEEAIGRIASLIVTAAKERTIVLVEHNLNVVARLSQRITVLRRGQILTEGSYREVSEDPRVIEAYLGGSDEP